jgi:DtxR family Mn-dependent transcriptional regulator
VADSYHPAVEEYLEAIYALEEDGEQVIQARLAERLGHAAPTVSEMVHRLVQDSYVRISGRRITLTAAGRQRAESVVRKHRLAERLLADVIGLDWHKIHIEAGRWEHVISDEVERRLVGLLGNPATCPHGNPIPGAGGARDDLVPLTQVTPGERVRLERVTESVEVDGDAIAWLHQHGLRPGVDGQLKARGPDGTLTLLVGGRTVALGAAFAGRLYVTREAIARPAPQAVAR